MNNDNGFIREYFDSLSKEITHMTQSFEQDIKDMYKDLEKEERKQMKRDHQQQMRDLDELMSAFDDFYRQNQSSLSDLDKAMYQTLVTNRKKDIKRFDTNIQRTFSNLDREIDKMGNSFDRMLGHFDTALGKFKDIIDTMNLSSIVENGLAKDEESLFEISQTLIRTTKYTKESLESLGSLQKDIHSLSGGAISKSEFRNALMDIKDATGLSDPKALEKLASSTIYALEYLEVAVDDISNLYKAESRLGANNYVRDITDILAQMQEEGLNVNMDNITEVLNQATPYMQHMANGNESVMKKMSKELVAAITAGDENYADISEVVSNFMTGSYDLDSYMGSLAWRNQGNLTGFMSDVINTIHAYDTGNPQLNRMIYGDLGIDPDFAQQVLASNMTASEWLADYNKNLSLASQTQENEAQMLMQVDTMTQTTEKIYNWLSQTGLGNLLENTFVKSGFSLADIWAGGSMLSGGLKLGKSLLGKLFGGGAAGAGAAGAAGAGGGGLLAGLGTKIAGGLATIGGGSAVLGGGAILGGIGSLLGTGAGILDLWNSRKLEGEAKEVKMFQGGSKIGMVGTGAAAGAAIGSVVPGLGTAIGALIGGGIGGIGALLGGNKVGELLKGAKDKYVDWWTGNKDAALEKLGKVKDTMFELKDKAFSKVGEWWNKGWEGATNIWDNVKTGFNNFKDSFKTNVVTWVSGIFTSASEKVKDNPVIKVFSSIGEAIGNGVTSAKNWFLSLFDGSHKNGLDKVPYDGYVAELHKNEAVLTANQAEQWRKGNSQISSALMSKLVSSQTNFLKQASQTTKTDTTKTDTTTPNHSSSGYNGPTIGSANIGTGIEVDVWKALRGLGYSKAATAGVMGNLYQESGLNPSAIQGGGRGPAAGIAQWENYTSKSGRWKALSNYATQNKQSWTHLQTQLAWLDKEMQGADSCTLSLLKKKVGGYNAFKALSDVEKATLVFEESFERAGKPMMQNRYNAAHGYYNKYNAYKQGTPWVPNTQLALLHKGEMVVPASHNPANSSTQPLVDNTELINVIKWGFNELFKRLPSQATVRSSAPRSSTVGFD